MSCFVGGKLMPYLFRTVFSYFAKRIATASITFKKQGQETKHHYSNQRRLESKDINSSLNRVGVMAMPQLVWVNVESSSFSPFAADLHDGVACEMPIPPGTWEDELFISASTKLLKEAKRC